MKLSRIVKLVKEATATIHRNLRICPFWALMANVYQELGKTCRQNWFRHLSKQKLISSFVKELRESSGLQIFYWTREKVSCAGNDTNVRQAAVSSFVFCSLYFVFCVLYFVFCIFWWKSSLRKWLSYHISNSNSRGNSFAQQLLSS